MQRKQASDSAKTESFWLKVSQMKDANEEEEKRIRAESEPTKKISIPSPRSLGKNKSKEKGLREEAAAGTSPGTSSGGASSSLFPPYLGPPPEKKKGRKNSRSHSPTGFLESPDRGDGDKKKDKKKEKRKSKRDIPDPKGGKLHTVSAPSFEKKLPESDSDSDSSTDLPTVTLTTSTAAAPSTPPPSSPSPSPSRSPEQSDVKKRLQAQSQPVMRQHRPASPKRAPSPRRDRDGKGEDEETDAFFSSTNDNLNTTSTSSLTNSILEGNNLRVSVKEDIESDYELGEMLGSGAFAIVYKAKNLETGEQVAVKKIKKNVVKDSEIKNLRLEVKILTELNHPGIIRLIDVYEEEEFLFIITELMEGGELLDRLSERKTFCEEDAIQLVKNILEAIRYLHDLKIAHRDLKPENLLLKSKDNDTDVRLADFGISRFFDEGFMKTTCGTPAYTAPEVLESSSYTMAVDLWSIGIITYLLLSGKTPFQANSMPRMFMKIMEADFDFPEEDWANVSEGAKHFITQLLRKNPLKRMPAAEALKHRWLTEKGGKRMEQNLSTLASLKSMGARKRGISHG